MANIAREAALDTHSSGTDEELDRVALDRAMAGLGERKTSHAGARRFVRSAIGFAAVGAAAAAAIALAVSHTPRTTTATTTAGSVTSTRPLILADGSEIAPEDAATPIQISEETPLRTTVRLSAGAARFRVRHDDRRLFRVDAGSIEIEDLGTVFGVAHEPEGRVRVTVSEGRVAVVSTLSRLRVELGPGDDRVFSATAALGELVEQPSEATPSEAPKTAVVPVSGSIHAQSRAHGADDPASLLDRRRRRPAIALAP